MTNKHISILFLFVILSLLSGCGSSAFNCTRLEQILGRDADLVKFSYTIADDLANSAMPPLMPMNPQQPVLTTTLVDNSNLNKTTKLGRIIQEHVGSRFVQLGYTVREIKLEKELHITPGSGETMLTRDSTKLEATQQAQAIFVGTFSRANRTLYISARLIDPHTNNIIASTDYNLCIDTHISSALGLNTGYEDMIQEPKRPFLNSIFRQLK